MMGLAPSLTAAGALHAATILVSVALGAGLARRRGLVPRLIVEIHAIAVPVAALLSLSSALVAAFPAFLHDREVLAQVVTSGWSPWPAIVGVALLLALMAWASGRPRALVDCMAPGGLLIACAFLVDITRPLAASNLVITLVAALVAPTSHRVAMRAAHPGEAALMAGEGLVLAAASTLMAGPIPSLGLVGCAAALGLLVMVHVLLRAGIGSASPGDATTRVGPA